MKFACLVLAIVVIYGCVPSECSGESHYDTLAAEHVVASIPIEVVAENEFSLSEATASLDSGLNEQAEKVAPKTCTCTKDDTNDQKVPAVAVVPEEEQESRLAPKGESAKTNKKTNGKKYRVITITLPEESQTSAEIVSGLGGLDYNSPIVSSYTKDEEKTTTPKEVDSEESKTNDGVVVKADDVNEDVEQLQEATPSKKSQKESKSKANDRNKKTSDNNNNKRSKRDAKGSSGQSKSQSKNKEKLGNKNREKRDSTSDKRREKRRKDKENKIGK